MQKGSVTKLQKKSSETVPKVLQKVPTQIQHMRSNALQQIRKKTVQQKVLEIVINSGMKTKFRNVPKTSKNCKTNKNVVKQTVYKNLYKNISKNV